MALAVTCPSGFSEFLIDDAHVVVPLSERCPDGYSQIYTVDDCAELPIMLPLYRYAEPGYATVYDAVISQMLSVMLGK